MKLLLLLIPILIAAIELTRPADFNSLSYNSNNNFKDNVGQCTWYVDGRIQEKLGIKLKLSQTPKVNSIAVWSHGKYGHVAFVEDGHHGHIHFTEANVPPNHKIDEFGGRLKKASTRFFEQRIRNTKFLGYIHLD